MVPVGGAVVETSAALVAVRVTPRRSLLRNGVIAALVGGVPLFGVLYWLAIAQGSWLRVFVIQVIVTGIALIMWLRYRAGFAEVRNDTITKQAFAHRTVVSRPAVVSVVIAQTHNGTADAVPQLLALDGNGTRLMRMRGHYWRREDMVRIAEAIGAPILFESDTMTPREFYSTYPGVAYWYEGRPWIAAVGILLALGIAFVIMSWLMLAIGAPSVLSAA